MEPIEAFDRAGTAATAVVNGIGDDQWDLPTPCAEWTVRGVLNHLVIVGMIGEAIVAGRAHPDQRVDHLGRDPKATFATTLAANRATVRTPGLMGRVVSTPMGERPGSVLVDTLVAELVVHTWDLARATGQDTDLDPELAQEVRTSWTTRLGDRPRTLLPYEEPQPVPDGATAADRLAAYLGRTVVVA
ncbi:MAG TPA: TIGR03086 family metal-binding protein [Pseudonocardiaceae bacterium]|nr:TIGR03086 family metal-binding protein [Pseudonocardiaceae bacterium]